MRGFHQTQIVESELVSTIIHTIHNSPAVKGMSLCHQVTAVMTHCVQNFSVHYSL